MGVDDGDGRWWRGMLVVSLLCPRERLLARRESFQFAVALPS